MTSGEQNERRRVLEDWQNSVRGARGKQVMDDSYVQDLDPSVVRTNAALPPQPRRRSNRRAAPRSERARLSDIENRLDQVLNMFVQRQAIERERDSMTRRSPAPVDSPRTRAPSRSRGEGGAVAGKNITQGYQQHFTEPEAARAGGNQHLENSRAKRNRELESPLPRSLSEVYSSPNHRLRRCDLRCSLNTKRLARGVAGGTQFQSKFEQMSQEEFEGQYHQDEGNRRHARPKAGEYGIFTEQPTRAANPAAGQARAWPEPSASDFRRFLGGLVPGVLVQPLSHTVSPFTEQIRQATLPMNFKVSSMERYEGKSDPIEHLAAYRGWMEFKGAGDAAMSQVFPLTLGGRARTWFISLKLGTISSFAQLENYFIAQFLGARPVKKLPSHLSSTIL